MRGLRGVVFMQGQMGTMSSFLASVTQLFLVSSLTFLKFIITFKPF